MKTPATPGQTLPRRAVSAFPELAALRPLLLFLKTLIPLFLVAAFLGGCAQPRLIEPDLSADIMNAITGRMDQLKQTDADRSEWNKAASSATVLHTLTDLHKALPIGVPANEIERQRERRH